MAKILIADDSIAVRKVAERLLTEAGMAVSLAANGAEALAFLGRERPDLVVSDVIMPDKSGYEVCSFVRAQPALAGIPVLLISGIVNDEVTKQADSCHADGVLKKPFQGTSLKDRVQDLLSKHEGRKGAAPVQQALSGNGKAPVPEAIEPLEKPKAPSVPVHHDSLEVVTAAIAKTPTESGSVREAEPNDQPDSPSSLENQRLAARVAELEAALEEHRRRETEFTAKVNDLESQAQRASELDTMLTQERESWSVREREIQEGLQREQDRTRQLSEQVETLQSSIAEEQRRGAELLDKVKEGEGLAARIQEVESVLAVEREQMSQLSEKADENARKAARVQELEATLSAERDAASQLVQQITALEKVEGRVKDLEARLSSERDKSGTLLKQIADLEERAARVKELEGVLLSERERTAHLETTLFSEREQTGMLVQKLKDLEQAVTRAQELDSVLATERERSTQLAKRATEAEQSAEQSNRRFEEMARKLAEIAGLASKLGSGKR
ncbi:MAG: response regulator [Nitrospiraceae bacterium]